MDATKRGIWIQATVDGRTAIGRTMADVKARLGIEDDTEPEGFWVSLTEDEAKAIMRGADLARSHREERESTAR